MAEPLPINVSPQEAIDFFEAKGRHVGFHWADTLHSAHGRSFTVAKMMQADLLADTQRVVETAIKEGWSFQRFQAELEPMLRARGWWGKQEMVDPLTGEVRQVQLGSQRRLRIIYDTNMRTAAAAGQWERIVRTARHRPYLRYVGVLDDRIRPMHRAMHGTILPFDDPFWDTWYPPNGWNCRCRVVQLSQDDLTRRGWRVSDRPSMPNRYWRNPRTGEVLQVPIGIDPGFGYHVGRANPQADAAQQLLHKAAVLTPELAQAVITPQVWQRIRPHIQRDTERWVLELTVGLIRAQGETRIVGMLPPGAMATLAAQGQPPASAMISAKGEQLMHALRDAKAGAGKAVSRADLARLVDILDHPRAVLRERDTGELLFVFDPSSGDRTAKIVVKVNYRVKVRDHTGRRATTPTNAIRTAGLVPLATLQDAARYDVIEGSL